ncbi:MAG: NgoFVII family restriction endonuclease, partial [Lachnospiraceae bacterium]|nr:NgoFVII family restriction endonuclease [Lachnospiraceae bacterium]
EPYFKMLKLMGSLSKLFSESSTPFIHYRVTENVFCKYFNAENLSRTDTAYDARIGQLGIGIKTFQLKANNSSVEKIAEFNMLSPELRQLQGKELAAKLACYRNERMSAANHLYGINRQIYHIVGRRRNRLVIFNSEYEPVDENSLRVVHESEQSLHFKDCRHEYTFNKSKSVMMKRFVLPEEYVSIDVDIIADPYELLQRINGEAAPVAENVDIRDSVVLPLYSTRKVPAGVIGNSQGKWVPTKSGLNQWNAAGRPRDPNEVYIPIPSTVHRNFSGFFPDNETQFLLRLPDGNTLTAKVCQEGDKALLSNPNKALGKWILRQVLGLEEGKLLTIERLDAAGFDTIVVYKNADLDYSINVYHSSTENDENG